MEPGAVTLETISLSNTGIAANAASGSAEVSDDGRVVAFRSLASNLVDETRTGSGTCFSATANTATHAVGEHDAGDARGELMSGPRTYCTLAVTLAPDEIVNVQVRRLSPPLEHAPDQIASRPLVTLSVMLVPGVNDALPVLPVATLIPAGDDVTRSPLRPVAVTVSGHGGWRLRWRVDRDARDSSDPVVDGRDRHRRR